MTTALPGLVRRSGAVSRPVGQRLRSGHADAQEQLRVARIATFVLGLVAVMLGIILKGQNVAFMVDLACAIAASSNFPALVLLGRRYRRREGWRSSAGGDLSRGCDRRSTRP
ncbi:MAG TPA: hypothetical protein VH879_05165 [Gemmatimonadales bacterium]